MQLMQVQSDACGGCGRGGAKGDGPELMRAGFGGTQWSFAADDPLEKHPPDKSLDKRLRMLVTPRTKHDRYVRELFCGIECLQGGVKRWIVRLATFCDDRSQPFAYRLECGAITDRDECRLLANSAGGGGGMPGSRGHGEFQVDKKAVGPLAGMA